MRTGFDTGVNGSSSVEEWGATGANEEGSPPDTTEIIAPMGHLDRRRFLGMGLAATGAVATFGPGFWRRAYAAPAVPGDGPYGSIEGREPDENGIILPEGFSSRVIARAGEVLPGAAGYAWHADPDGGAVFPTGDGGWIYVSNQEERFDLTGGGVGAIRFDADGTVVDAYRILDGTYTNCAGGPTPWGTWLSCEEHAAGLVWECDPFGEDEAVPRPAMGAFFHEAAFVDDRPEERCVYLTEDANVDGRFYRFTPTRYPDLSEGVLEAAVASNEDGTGAIIWVEVNPALAAMEAAARGAHSYLGAEGVWIDSGLVYFTTKVDDTVWVYDPKAATMDIVYRAADWPEGADAAPLTGVDNIVFNDAGELFVAEDGGNMELVLITPERVTTPFLRVVGQDGSELAGPAFDPSGTRLYLSSMRGTSGQFSSDGITYEISGPFNTERLVTQETTPTTAALAGLGEVDAVRDVAAPAASSGGGNLPATGGSGQPALALGLLGAAGAAVALRRRLEQT
jgi:uncharacterized protein